MKRRDQLRWVARSQHIRRNVLDEQKLEPVEKLGGRRVFLQSRNLTDIKAHRQGFAQQFVLQIREMHVDDLLHCVPVWKADVMEETAAQESVGQLLLVVGG